MAKNFFKNTNCKKLLENIDNILMWENITVSDYSPGKVLNSEIIGRQIHSPIHINEEKPNQLNNFAFEDMINKGLSINRFKYSHKSDLHKRGREKAENDRLGKNASQKPKPERKYIGLAIANVKEIRDTFEEEKRCFTIYDTASSDCPSHADLYCIFTKCRTELVKTRQARKLQKIFSTIEYDPEVK